MTAPTVALAEFEGKKVLLGLNGEDPFEATVETANDQAVIFKRKGKAQIEFESASSVTSIALQPDAEPEVKARRVDHVNLGNVKRHLVDRHGYSVADINAMKAVDALAFHDSIEHAPLGHFHADKPEKAVDPKVKESDSDSE